MKLSARAKPPPAVAKSPVRGARDSSPGRHATAHFHSTGHPIIEGYDPPEGWGWCYVDEAMLDLSDQMTPRRRYRRYIRVLSVTLDGELCKAGTATNSAFWNWMAVPGLPDV